MKRKHLEIWLFTILLTLFSLYIAYCKMIPKYSEFVIYMPKKTASTHTTIKTQDASHRSETLTFYDENAIVNINSAGLNELVMLNGIGEVIAQRIIDYREANGKFQSVESIMNVKGIGEGIFSKIVNNITV